MKESYKWNNISISICGKDIIKTTELLSNISGEVKRGELMAIMGPSGSGKTTLLNHLAHRSPPLKSKSSGSIKYCSKVLGLDEFRNISTFVEQEDSLIGSLTVKETIYFGARFARTPTKDINHVVNEIIEDMGLLDQANIKIGSPIQKGISGGQKRRTSIAAQLVTKPTILFLDEPTSGLDSFASKEVISAIKNMAKRENMIVICSIHQPSTSAFNLFDKVLFLSKGKTVFNGPVSYIPEYFNTAGYQIPQYYNPSEFVLSLINSDFSLASNEILDNLFSHWNEHEALCEKDDSDDFTSALGSNSSEFSDRKCSDSIRNTQLLLSRGFKKSRRDILTYHIRIVMYLCLAILMGTVWLRLDNSQENIQPFINAIFFSGAFMSFMSVAYIPSYLEDYYSYKKDVQNGLYGPLSFLLSNLIIGIPFLFLVSLLFSIVTYFMANFRLSALAFFYYVLWLHLDLLAAESLTILISTIFPNFVISLAMTAFANGLWMSVGGFLVPAKILNQFWYYTFYWINYQRYVFQGMMFNEFEQSVFRCDSSCHCLYVSDLQAQCKITGTAVLETLGYGKNETAQWIGIMLVLIFSFRLATYIVLKIRK